MKPLPDPEMREAQADLTPPRPPSDPKGAQTTTGSSAGRDLKGSSLIVIVGAFLAMVAFSWQKWADPLVDFGRELYIPWRLCEGDLLYRDIAHYYAPFSSYINVFWFTLLGVSYRSLFTGNAILLAALLFLLFRLLRRMASLEAATTAILVVILAFAFGQYVPNGNYNYLSPYSHELTHGLLLSLIALTAAARYFETGRKAPLILCGGLLGLVFLTKYEVFIAAAGAITVGVASFWWRDRRRLSLPGLLALLASLPMAFLFCWALLARTLPVGTSFWASLGPYPALFEGEITMNPFFLVSAGLGRPGAAAAGILGWAAFYTLSTLPLSLLCRAAPRLDQRIQGAVAFLAPALLLSLASSLLSWPQSLSPLPLFLLLGLVATIWFGTRPGRPWGPVDWLRFTLTAFSLLLLLKVPFNARISHYGFALAMPGVAVLVVTATDSIPAWLDSVGLSGRLFRAAFRGLLVVFVGSHLLISSWFFAQRTYAMGQGPDTLRVNGRGAVVAQAAQMVRERAQPGETLVVFPEGAMVNYLTRIRSSIPHLDFDPVTLAKDGEDAVVNELKSHPPDHVLAFSRHVRDLREYGCVTFGEDCAKEIGAWLKAGYSARILGVSQGRLMFILLAPIPAASPAPSPEVVEVDSLDGAGLQR